MDPNIKNQNQPIKTEPEKDEKYAEALVAMANMELKMDQAKTPKSKPFLSKKKLIYIGVSLVLTLLSFVTAPAMFKGSPEAGTSDKGTTQKLLNGANELQELQDE